MAHYPPDSRQLHALEETVETIDIWLIHMFAPFPQTAQLNAAREELKQMMTDKYESLIDEGATEATALGTVIDDFGDLSELAPLLGIDDVLERVVPTFTREDAERLQNTVEATGWMLAVGVVLSIMSPVPLFLLHAMYASASDATSVVGIGGLIALVAIAVPLFLIRNGRIRSAEKPLKGALPTPDMRHNAETMHEFRRARWETVRNTCISILIMSAFPLIASGAATDNETYQLSGMIVTLTMVAITVGIMLHAYSFVTAPLAPLEAARELTDPERLRDEKRLSVLSTSFWLLALGIYLVWSFAGNAWDRSWIVWPVAGLFYGVMSVVLG
ncbi:MAG: permease prefix domain 1-containing protein, partial [Actinomycetaceae bacterium]|nr:permease prefix domain 1-containing protein [Actinomycetaceae bacterium]